MSEVRSNRRQRLSSSLLSPFQHIGRGLRIVVLDTGVALPQPSTPPTIPALRDYLIGVHRRDAQ
jgi:hypothetical protein